MIGGSEHKHPINSSSVGAISTREKDGRKAAQRSRLKRGAAPLFRAHDEGSPLNQEQTNARLRRLTALLSPGRPGSMGQDYPTLTTCIEQRDPKSAPNKKGLRIFQH
ncbi:MAG: hypothetical protein RL518_2598 [Pseudomonadota bacterium]